MKKRWALYNKHDTNASERLAGELNISPLLTGLLINRGILSFNEAKTFFRPTLTDLHNPFLMKGMDIAVERIEKAIAQNEKILVYGDYDVDGTTAVSLVYSFLKKRHENIDFYIPDRYKEGYGISFQGIDWAAENGFSLIIALDCGIKSVAHVDYAKQKSVDFIICDHHLPGEQVPAAIAVLDPKQNDCAYPYKELSGCGIGFKLVQAFAAKNAIAENEVMEYLDLTAVSIAADIVPITGENRILAYFGIQKLNTSPCKGLKALMDISGLKKEKLTITDVVFGIAPRINAAGRMDDARHAVRLLTAQFNESTLEKATLINIKNNDRRDLDKSITDQALEMIAGDSDSASRKTTVLFNPDWHKGVIGIVASRLIEKHYRPTIVLTRSNGVAAGSARSVKGFDLYEAISSCSDLLEQYGGHKYAAGLTIQEKNLPAFIEKFDKVVAETITESALLPEIAIDNELDLKDLTPKLIRIIKQFEPFGPGNMNPVFVSRALSCPYGAQVVGGSHLKFTVKSAEGPNFACIAFNFGHYFNQIKSDSLMDICYTIEENVWNGKTTVQLNIKDININT